MSPKLNLQIDNFLDALAHHAIQPLELLDLRQLRVNVVILHLVITNLLLNPLLVPEYRELLLKRWPFFGGHVELVDSRMDVLHD